jgi:hypothetical protein
MANVTINKKLNLVIPLEIDDNKKMWVHSTPISREVFEANYMLFVKTLSNLYFNGIGPGMAPRVAALALKDMAKEIDNTTDLSMPVIQEIYRLTYVLMIDPATNKWIVKPFLEIKMKNMLEEEVIREVENALVYFTVASAIHLKSELPSIMIGLSSIWEAQTTSLTAMDYCNSLTISNQEENTGESPEPIQKVSAPKALSIPS